ncbi:nitrate- and nitrite sensing domain-containing protein [Nonomuraea sp. NPDC049725]|uniref:sensor histidine kinase n=1 Tax=Nonomuraea sp. NPDC049725 TaxID=3154508 RepID=UPI003420C69E
MSTELGRRPPEEGNWRLRNWRVRARLVALILVPTAAAVLLGGFQVFTSTGAAADYERTSRLAQLSGQVGALTHEVAAERARMAWHIARGRPQSRLADVHERIDRADEAIQRVRGSATAILPAVSGRTADQIENMLNRLDDLLTLRQQALKGDLLAAPAVDLYTVVIDDLLSVHDELIKGSQDDELIRQSRMLHALAGAKESLSLQQAVLTIALTDGAISQEQLKGLLGELSREENERAAFADEATAAERRFFDETVNGRSADAMLFLRELVLIRATAGQPLRGLDQNTADDAGLWFKASTTVVDSLRTVEQRQAGGILARSHALSADERQRAYVIAGAVIALLLAVLLITTGVARSLVRPLRRLRSEALEIAGRRLPDFVQHLRESRDGDIDAEVPPIHVFTRDEVGEVARAFDEVHREAVRLAGDEARLRANVNAMFVNLSRRSQTLVERQLTLIERLERGERDDTRLGDLFKLDHLATRMRRNSENLLVLAGQEAARRWSEPVELMDIVRASLGEVENYDRVSVQIQSQSAVLGQAVNDVVHLLAELIENAVSFSARDTKVVISSNRIDGGGLMVSVSDSGIAMTPDELAQANWRLANPPVVDVSVSRRMGLFVVGRLALRHNIKVQLRRQDTGGLTAMVVLPEALLTPIPHPPTPALDTTPPPPVPPLPTPEPPTPPTPGPPAADATPEPSSWFTTDHAPSTEPPAPPRQGDFLPIFASLESSWFTKPSPTPDHRTPGASARAMGEAPSATAPASTGPGAAPSSEGAQSPEGGSSPVGGPSQEGGPSPEGGASLVGEGSGAPRLPRRSPVGGPAAVEGGGASGAPRLPQRSPAGRSGGGSAVGSGLFVRAAEGAPSGDAPAATGPGDATSPEGGPSSVGMPSREGGPASVGAPAVVGEGSGGPRWAPGGGSGAAEGGGADGEGRVPGGGGANGSAGTSGTAVQGAGEGAVTRAGLPRRTPRANLVAGSAPPSSLPPPAPPVSPDRLRTRLSSYQQGVRKGRAELEEDG